MRVQAAGATGWARSIGFAICQVIFRRTENSPTHEGPCAENDLSEANPMPLLHPFPMTTERSSPGAEDEVGGEGFGEGCEGDRPKPGGVEGLNVYTV